MEKTEIVDEMDHGFFPEQAYMVSADDLEGKSEGLVNCFMFH